MSDTEWVLIREVKTIKDRKGDYWHVELTTNELKLIRNKDRTTINVWGEYEKRLEFFNNLQDGWFGVETGVNND